MAKQHQLEFRGVGFAIFYTAHYLNPKLEVMFMDSLHKQEAKLDHQMHAGNAVAASMTLRNEMESNPQEALALIKSELCAATYSNNKYHVGVASNGDVSIYNQDNSMALYAGHLSAEQNAQLACFQPPKPAEATPPPVAHHEAPKALAAPTQLQPGSGPQAYEYQQPRQPGAHIPFPIDIGIHDGSLQVGVNLLGLVKGGVLVGEHTRGYVGSDVAQTEVSAGVDFSQQHIGPAADWRVLNGGLTSGNARVGIDPSRGGIDVGAGVDATALAGTIGTGAHGGVELGRRVGPHVNGYGYVGPAGVSADGYGNLSDQGLRAGADADVSAQPAIGIHGKVRAGLGTRNEAHADVGANLADNGASLGAGLYPQLHPDIYARAHSGGKAAGVGLNPARAWSRGRQSDPSDIEMGGLY